MTTDLLRKEVLRAFKNLHRTRCSVFQNSPEALERVKKEINDAYKKNKNVSDSDAIKELIKLSNDVMYELKMTVAELEETSPGVFRLKLRPEMFEEYNNVPLKKLTKVAPLKVPK